MLVILSRCELLLRCTLYCQAPLYVLTLVVSIFANPTSMRLVNSVGAILRSAGSLTLCSIMGVSWMGAALHSALPLPLAWPQCASWKPRGATSSTRRAAAVPQTRLKRKLWCRSVQQSAELSSSCTACKACCVLLLLLLLLLLLSSTHRLDNLTIFLFALAGA